VVPVFKNFEVAAVLDVDREALNTFDSTDQKFLEEIVSLLNF
jgi:GAF domain-containing protein